MPDLEYICNLVKGIERRGSSTTEEPYRSFCNRVNDAESPDLPAAFLDFVQRNNGIGEDLIRRLVALQSTSDNQQNSRRSAVGRLISLNDLLGSGPIGVHAKAELFGRRWFINCMTTNVELKALNENRQRASAGFQTQNP